MDSLEKREKSREERRSTVASMLSPESIEKNVDIDIKGIVISPKAKEEIRNKRVNLVVKPSVYTEAQKKCKRLNISLNECFNQFLEAWINE